MGQKTEFDVAMAGAVGFLASFLSHTYSLPAAVERGQIAARHHCA